MRKGVKAKRHTLTKKEIEEKKNLAYVLYMAGEQQNMISDYVGITPKTVSGWVNDGKWADKRAAATVTRPELVNKILQSIGKMLDKHIEGEDVNNLEDKLAKFAKGIEALDKKNNPVDAMEWYQKLNTFMMSHLPTDKELTPAIIKLVNRYQVKLVNSILNNE